MTKTKLYVRAEDLGKNAYRKRTYYTLLVEQDVLAKSQDEADELFRDGGGINYDKITSDLVLAGKVVLNPDNDYAEEDGDVVLDAYADEINQTKETA